MRTQTQPELCEKCGAQLYRKPLGGRLCPTHLQEAQRAAGPFACTPADIDSGHDEERDECPECLHPWASHRNGRCSSTSHSIVLSYGEVVHDGSPRPCDCTALTYAESLA